jgi:hypothetical protein
MSWVSAVGYLTGRSGVLVWLVWSVKQRSMMTVDIALSVCSVGCSDGGTDACAAVLPSGTVLELCSVGSLAELLAGWFASLLFSAVIALFCGLSGRDTRCRGW